MSVKLSRYIFRKVGGVVIPVRDTAKAIGTRAVRILPELAPPKKLSEYFDIKQGLKSADFFLQRKGSDKTVGLIRKGFEAEDIGVKVKNTSEIIPDFAKYGFMNLHNIGFWKNKAKGTLNLKNIRTSEVANSSIEDLFPSMKIQRENYEKSAFATQLAISRKANDLLRAEIKKGAKLVSNSKDTMRLVSGIDRKVNARGAGVRFVRINGRVVPIRIKK